MSRPAYWILGTSPSFFFFFWLFELPPSSKLHLCPDSRTSPSGQRALGRGILESSSEGSVVNTTGT